MNLSIMKLCAAGALSAMTMWSSSALAQSTQFCNATAVTIPAAGTSGPSTPFPSTITVSGVGSAVTSVTVQLLGLNHTFADDVDVLLVGPQGQNLILMSDTGGSTDFVATDHTFDDTAGGALADNGPAASGTFLPTNIGAGDAFSAPAPAPSGATTLATFNGTDPNGVWSLYVQDDLAGDTGNLSGGWCINVAAGLASQTISFGAAPGRIQVGRSGSVSATATSGLAVSFSSLTPPVCTIAGSVVTGVAAGTCIIAADQAGNGSFDPAPQVTQSFNIAVPTSIPTLSEWGMIIMSLLLALATVFGSRRWRM